MSASFPSIFVASIHTARPRRPSNGRVWDKFHNSPLYIVRWGLPCPSRFPTVVSVPFLLLCVRVLSLVQLPLQTQCASFSLILEYVERGHTVK